MITWAVGPVILIKLASVYPITLPDPRDFGNPHENPNHYVFIVNHGTHSDCAR